MENRYFLFCKLKVLNWCQLIFSLQFERLFFAVSVRHWLQRWILCLKTKTVLPSTEYNCYCNTVPEDKIWLLKFSVRTYSSCLLINILYKTDVKSVYTNGFWKIYYLLIWQNQSIFHNGKDYSTKVIFISKIDWFYVIVGMLS